MNNKEVLKQIKTLQLGDLVRVDWFDASTGRALAGFPVDIPVKSWGIYLGVIGEKNKQIILAQNNFKFSDGIYDIDYTAVPVTWTVNISIVASSHVPSDEAETLLRSFISGKRQSIRRRISQGRVVNHEKLG